MERQKLEFEVNKPTPIKLLFDDCVTGSSKYGKYYMYAVQNGDGSTEYSLFAPEALHDLLKKHKKGDNLLVTKIASQRGQKLVIAWDVQKENTAIVNNPTDLTNEPDHQNDLFYTTMEKSFEDALRIQNKFNGMANVNQLAVTIYISRLKQNNSYAGG